jgi:three-Cys-motif partner protein
MSTKNLGVVWKAEPHTIAKTEVLRAYLVAYFQILGISKPRQTLLYVDGFAGPDQYMNFSHGSPTAALKAAQEAIANSQKRWVADDIHCAFIEPDPKRFENMDKKIHPFRGARGLKIYVYNADFVTGLAVVRKDIPAPLCESHPLFVFIDPFGATGAPFSVVREILNSGCSEVLINLDADGIARIYRAKDEAKHEQLLTTIYGDQSWSGELTDEQPFPVLCRKALDLYTKRLRSVTGVRYVFSFEMQKQAGALNYFLVFASKHPLGLVKMKEAMKRIDQDGSYRFADANVSQPSLFRFDDPEQYARLMHRHFEGRCVSYGTVENQINDYALNQTPFLNAKAMLTVLEKQELISVISHDAKRRKGTFKEGVIKEIQFIRTTDGFQF